MNDAKHQLRPLDKIDPPDVWKDASSRRPGPEDVGPVLGPTLPRRVVAGVLAFVIFGAAGAFAWQAFRGEEHPNEQARPAGWSQYSAGWTRLPEPSQRESPSGSGWVWTGTELIGWGGSTYNEDSPVLSSGQRFDPSTGAWRPLPEAPEGRSDMQTIWTGDQILFWGGYDDDGSPRMDGLSFDPLTDRWARIPPAPLNHQVATSVWTGSEMIVWGGGERGSASSRQGAAYDPVAGSWRELAPAPVGLNHADAIWTGREMIVFGSSQDGRNIAETETAVGARYDPASDRWAALPPSDLSPQATAIGLVDGQMIAYDYLVEYQAYDLLRERWDEPAPMPMKFSECYPDLAAADDLLFAFFCGQAATYDGGSGEWTAVNGGMLDATYEVEGRSYSVYRFATLVPVDRGIVFAAQGITTTDSGEVCYGCPGSPTSLWLWRP